MSCRNIHRVIEREDKGQARGRAPVVPCLIIRGVSRVFGGMTNKNRQRQKRNAGILRCAQNDRQGQEADSSAAVRNGKQEQATAKAMVDYGYSLAGLISGSDSPAATSSFFSFACSSSACLRNSLRPARFTCSYGSLRWSYIWYSW